jgi:hypothetical protein
MHVSRLLRYSGLFLLALVLAIGPFFKGLFFWTELLAGIALTAAGFGLWLLGRRLGNLPFALSGGVPGLGLLALLACYVLQFAWAMYTRGNVDWVLRVAAAYLAFVMVRAEAGPSLRRVLAWLLTLSAAGLAVPGFLEYTGFFARNAAMAEALSIVNLQDRMATLMQYPNTAAIFFLAALLAATGLAVEERRPWVFAAAAGLMTLISVAFFFTVSRGAVVALPFGVALLLLGLDNARRWAALVLLGAAWVPAAAVLKPVGAAAATQATGTAFGWIAGAVVAGALIGLITAFFLRLKGRAQAVIAGAALLLAAGAFVALKPEGALLPKQAARLLDMNLRTGNVLYRFQLDEDALKIIADRPLGRGGWGWERSYRRYQETYYVGRETHNHYLQTGVEAGVPGMLVLVATMGAALWIAWRNRRGQPLAWSLAAAAGLIAGHSVIDFNLSYGVVWLWFWVLLAASADPLLAERWGRPPVRLATGAGAVAVALAATVLALGSWYTGKAETLAGTDQQKQAVAIARTAARLDPLSSAPLLVIGDRPSLERAAELDPYQPNLYWHLSVLLQNEQDWEGAVFAARATVENHPMVTLHHTKLASIAGNLMVSALHEGKVDRAKELAADLRQRGDSLQAEIKGQATRQGSWMGPKLRMEPEYKLRYGQALFLTGEPAAAETLLKDAAKVGLLDSEADIWLYALYEKRGDAKAMAALESKPWIRFRNVNPVYKAIRQW